MPRHRAVSSALSAAAERGLGRRALVWALVAFVLLFSYHCAWIWQGFDITDEGFNLTNQWLIVSAPEHYQWRTSSASVWLSDLLGGVWLKVVGSLGLLGARLGWALIRALTGVAAFLALQRFFPRLPSLATVVATAAAISFHGTLTLDYNNIPTLFLVCATAFLFASQDVRLPRQRRRSYAVAAGALLGLSFMARFPLVLSLPLPFLVPIIQAAARSRASEPIEWRLPFQALLGSCSVIALCSLGLAAAGHLRDYMAGVGSLFAAAPASSHSLASLVRTYAETTQDALQYAFRVMTARYEGWILLLLILVACVGPFGARILQNRRREEHKRLPSVPLRRRRSPAGKPPRTRTESWSTGPVLRWAAVLGAAGILCFCAYRALWGRAYATYALALPGLCLILFAAGVASSIPRARESLTSQRLVVLLTGLAVAAARMLGSNNGISSAVEGLWILLPAVFLVIPGHAFRDLSKWDSKPPWMALAHGGAQIRYAGVILATAALIGVGAAGAYIRYSNPYRDLTDRTALNTEIDHPLLRHIGTSAARAQSVSSLLGAMSLVSHAGDVVLAWDSIPMVHFATRTIPALGTPWPNLLDERALQRRLGEMWAAGGPALIVAMKVDTRSRTWAVSDRPAPSREPGDATVEWAAHGYSLAWQNEQFAIWLPLGSLFHGPTPGP